MFSKTYNVSSKDSYNRPEGETRALPFGGFETQLPVKSALPIKFERECHM